MSFTDLVNDLKSNALSFKQFIERAKSLNLAYEQDKELMGVIKESITANEALKKTFKDKKEYEQFVKQMPGHMEGMSKYFGDLFKDVSARTWADIHSGNENARWEHTSPNRNNEFIQKLIGMHRPSAASFGKLGLFGTSGSQSESAHRKEHTPQEPTPPNQTPPTSKKSP